MDIFGWIAVGLLTSVTGELILPGRNPAGIGVALLLGAAGSLLARFVVGLLGGAESTRFGVEAILWAVLGAFAVLALYRLGVSLRAR
ncbi:MAG: GlsB/YeaQ/YmgE family stress response membrane protein [Actinomycetota bacterium]|nr:GlsB/YeaQ/YmgE family stress response membrane protein [Rubrobacteraceae bacterium]MDQ3250960.1 GlsB/YeaQ/YmgE family stress response membrane protein [Actinomycetota bacterium]MDQ3498171.1 GlsB/YeaQ/YmgE family stress response membrane protein [Actinomycetota bacterium]